MIKTEEIKPDEMWNEKYYKYIGSSRVNILEEC